ncbi:MAG: hypothetical protein ABSG11_23640 [Candidatus Korobacteraceae bacterium]|jgi:hypothetical protein
MVLGTGNYSSGVTWSAAGGTVTAGGVFTPSGPPTAATITATSTQESTKSRSAKVKVNSTVKQPVCNITARGPILADGSLGSGNPLLGDVYQIQGTTPSENYVDDDEANNGTVTLTSPGGSFSVTAGMFLLSESRKGVNAYAVRWAAGNVGKANGSAWIPGTWTWSMNYTDHQSTPYSCTANGSVIVASAWNAGNGFLHNYKNTPNLVTDGNNKLFFPNGFDWYVPYNSNTGSSTSPTYGEAEVPALTYVTVSGTSVAYSSGVQFSTARQPSNITSDIWLCTSLPVCTPYYNVTINSGTRITLPSSAGTYSNPIPAYLGFTRDTGVSFNHAIGYQSTLANAAQFCAAWGENFNRLSMDNAGSPSLVRGSGNFLGTGYNSYNWSASGGALWGISAIDLWFAAAHTAGIHLMLGGPQGLQPCASYSCTSTTLSNLQNLFGYESARWGAFYDVLELANEVHQVPHTWVEYVGTLLTNGVSGIAGGNPADPYGHFFTNSYFPNNGGFYTPPYGPFSSGASDPYLNWVDSDHFDVQNSTVYSWFGTGSGRCPAYPGLGGNTLPRYNGEQAQQVGVAPSSQTVSNPKNETNGPRIVTEQLIFNQCGGAVFNAPGDYFGINSTKPQVSNTWYDFSTVPLLNFMAGLDPAAAPLTVTLGGGCSRACGYAGLGSSSHVRLLIYVSTGNGSTGVPSTVSSGTVKLSVPQSNMTCKLLNPVTGATLRKCSPSSGSQTINLPTFGGASQPDIWLQLDSPPN